MSTCRDLTGLLDSAPGDYSVAVMHSDGELIYGYADQFVRSAASLIKVPIAMSIIDAAIDLDRIVTLTEADRVDGDGAFDQAPVGTQTTIRDLLAHSLIESDNTASNLLIDQIGMAGVNGWIDRIGLRHTRLRRAFMDFAALAAGRDNTTTAAEMCALFHRLLDPRYADLIQLLMRAVGDGKLEAGVPVGIPIAHKVGNLDDPIVEHDAGIVFAPQPYIVALLAVDPPSVEVGRQTLAQASRIIWEMMNIEC